MGHPSGGYSHPKEVVAPLMVFFTGEIDMVILIWYRTQYVIMNQRTRVSFDIDIPKYWTEYTN